MIPLIEQHRSQIEALCRQYGITKLELFGSATDAARFQQESSDVDFLYELDADKPRLVERFLDFHDALEQLFGRKVHLVSARYLSNPYFIERVNQERETLYAA